MSPPDVSVLLPVRDAAEHLPACIASLEAQTLPGVEIVAVDDGSSDGSGELLDGWARQNRRVVVVHAGPAGIVPALEAARARAAGRWLARMDADDVAHPDRLRSQLALVEGDSSLGGCGCRVRYFPEERVGGGARRYQRWLNELVEPGEIARDAFVECPLAHPTFFVRADVLDDAGGYVDRGWPEDYDLVLRLLGEGVRLAKVPRVLLRWREAPERLSRTDPRYAPEAFRRCKVHHLARGPLARRNGAVVWGAGPTGKAFARTLLAGGGLLRAFVDLDPRKLGQEIHGVPVVAPEGVDAYRDALVLAAVGQVGARSEIRETLTGMGWLEGSEFLAVA